MIIPISNKVMSLTEVYQEPNVKRLTAENYEDFYRILEEIKEDEKSSDSLIYVLFYGALIKEQGLSWCPDCNNADPIIRDFIEINQDQFVKYVYLVTVMVEKWELREPRSAFTKDKKIHLETVPTLVRWEGPQRLEEDECANPALLQFLFEPALTPP